MRDLRIRENVRCHFYRRILVARGERVNQFVMQRTRDDLRNVISSRLGPYPCPEEFYKGSLKHALDIEAPILLSLFILNENQDPLRTASLFHWGSGHSHPAFGT